MSERTGIPTAVTEADFRAYRRRQNREIARYPAWWAYWKVRHLTWKRRRALRQRVRHFGDAVSFYGGLVSYAWDEARH